MQKTVPLRQRAAFSFTNWSHPIVGYVLCVPCVSLALLVPFVERHISGHTYFLGAPLLLVSMLLASGWGSGPAICAILLGLIALDYVFVPPYGQLSFIDSLELLPLLPYLVIGLCIVLLTARRETAKRRAIEFERQLRVRAEELEQLNQQLAQSNKVKEVFFSRASHEMKTPLTTIVGQAQLGLRRYQRLAQEQPQLEPVRASLEKIDEQANRLQRLIDDLLDKELLSSGKLHLQLKRCNLIDICQSVVDEQRELSRRTIMLSISEQPVILRADGLRLTQVLINLVTNAVKYSYEDSPIHVAVFSRHGSVLLQVRNRGICIPLEQQARIFEPFYRTPDAQDSQQHGWGLGLAICKDIVEQHNGRIWVESNEQETCFYVALPYA